MATFKHIKFGDGLTVIDEGAGVITVNGAGGPPGPTGADGATGATGATGPTVPAGAPAYPTPVVNGQWVKGVGGVPVWAAITAADVTNLVTDLAAKQSTSAKGAANGYASLDASGLVPVAQLPPLPGAELAYAQFTSSVAVAVSAESAAVGIVTAPTFTADGNPILVEFFAPAVSVGVAPANLLFNLYRDGLDSGRFGQIVNSSATQGNIVPVYMAIRVAPAAGSRTYAVRAWATSAAGSVNAGTGGGTGVNVPGFIRVTRI